MKIVRQIAIVLLFLIFGEIVSKFLPIPMPGSVIGMITLFLLFLSKRIDITAIEDFGNFLLKNLAFFFIPPGVAVIASASKLGGIWLKFILIMIISTIIVMVVTAYTVQIFIRKEDENE